MEDMSSEEEDQGIMENPHSEDETRTTSNRKVIFSPDASQELGKLVFFTQ